MIINYDSLHNFPSQDCHRILVSSWGGPASSPEQEAREGHCVAVSTEGVNKEDFPWTIHGISCDLMVV